MRNFPAPKNAQPSDIVAAAQVVLADQRESWEDMGLAEAVDYVRRTICSCCLDGNPRKGLASAYRLIIKADRKDVDAALQSIGVEPWTEPEVDEGPRAKVIVG